MHTLLPATRGGGAGQYSSMLHVSHASGLVWQKLSGSLHTLHSPQVLADVLVHSSRGAFSYGHSSWMRKQQRPGSFSHLKSSSSMSSEECL